MKFSVVIPCRNAARYIQGAIESVSSQTLQPIEVILIDDGSTDDSIEIAKRVLPDIKILQSNHRNGAGTRNVGIEAAKGDWIAFLDADDIWYSDHLERASALLAGSSDVGFLNWYDSFSNDAPENKISRENKISVKQPTSGLSDEVFFSSYESNHWFNMHGCVVLRQRLITVGMLDTTQIRRHDIEMWFRVIHGQTWSYDPIPSTAWRQDTPDSISRNVANAAYFAFFAIKKNLSALGPERGMRLLKNAAKSAMVRAYADGTDDDRKRIQKDVYEQLSYGNKVVFYFAKTCPFIFKKLILGKRKFLRPSQKP